MYLTIVAGARPNFMKIAPVIYTIHDRNRAHSGSIRFRLVHTGQHYDSNMSDTFFCQLGIPSPDVNLEAGGGTQAEQTAMVMTRFESFLSGNTTDLVRQARAVIADSGGVTEEATFLGLQFNLCWFSNTLCDTF